MSAYDIRIYGHRARYSSIRCRVRYLVLHDVEFYFVVPDIAPDVILYRYIPILAPISTYTTSCITRYRVSCHRVYHDIVFHAIVYYTISYFTPSCNTRYCVSLHRVIHDVVKHDIVIPDIVYYTVSCNTRYRSHLCGTTIS